MNEGKRIKGAARTKKKKKEKKNGHTILRRKKATNMNSKVCLKINEISLINFSKYDHRVIE